MIFDEIKNAMDIGITIHEFYRKHRITEEIDKKIYAGYFSDDVLICKNCSGFYDFKKKSPIIECPHCSYSFSTFGDLPGLISSTFDESKIIGYENEGQYIGRYSRNQLIILNNI